VKSSGVPRRHLLVDFDEIDARARRPVPHVALEAIDRLGVALHGDLHAPVGKVSDPPVQAVAHRRGFGEKTKADTLNASAD